jgi:UPF0716 protein FxsA
VGRRLRVIAGLLALAELVVFILVAQWIGVGLTILATLATSALGWTLLARQGMRAVADLRERARTRQAPGKELGDAGLVALGGLLMVLPGFVGDLIGLLCLMPGTRRPIRALLGRVVLSRLPDRMRGPVRVRSARSTPVGGPVAAPSGAGPFGDTPFGTGGYGPIVIEGEVVRDSDGRPAV